HPCGWIGAVILQPEWTRRSPPISRRFEAIAAWVENTASWSTTCTYTPRHELDPDRQDPRRPRRDRASLRRVRALERPRPLRRYPRDDASRRRAVDLPPPQLRQRRRVRLVQRRPQHVPRRAAPLRRLRLGDGHRLPRRRVLLELRKLRAERADLHHRRA